MLKRFFVHLCCINPIFCSYVPSFKEFSDPNFLIAGKLRDVFVSRTGGPIDWATVSPCAWLTTSFQTKLFVCNVDAAEGLFFIFARETPQVHIGLFHPIATVLVFLWEQFMIEFRLPQRLFTIIVTLVSCHTFILLSTVMILCAKFTFAEFFVTQVNQADICWQHHFMVTLDTFNWIFHETSFRIEKSV